MPTHDPHGRPPAVVRREPRRVLVVDDHRTFAELASLALGSEVDLECVGTAHDAQEARADVARHDPDLVLMDVDLGAGDGGEDGLGLAAELTTSRPSLLVVVLTGHIDLGVMRRAASAGACALLTKGGSLRELLDVLRDARPGEFFVQTDLLRSLVSEQGEEERRWVRHPALTPREVLVLQLLSDGRYVADIARELGISVHTCRGYVKTLLAKLGAHSQLEAVAIASRRGLLETTPRVHRHRVG
ncbi:response regulator transcription factor [Nocardioides sp. AX2bis]|uniref:response regulator transcription factor n=1 Tax=Nocardioides sp. AX2bis TaxID=2653157 RepID=UPI001358518E|nr:response regulator transcription factor [Nocardioides sp. AX2bis]